MNVMCTQRRSSAVLCIMKNYFSCVCMHDGGMFCWNLTYLMFHATSKMDQVRFVKIECVCVCVGVGEGSTVLSS